MRVSVDLEACEKHGQCALVAPSNFTMDADGELQWRSDVAAEDEPEVEEAVDLCPVQAIALTR